MSPGDFRRLSELCATHAGLAVDVGRTYLIEHRLGPVARRAGYTSVAELLEALRIRPEARLIRKVVQAMAPAQTAFFREPEVFEAVVRDLQAAARGAPLRIWSAACGTGQEVYSLAMLLAERGVDGVELLASDLADQHLEKARSGLYSRAEAQQGLSTRRLVRHFVNDEDGFVLDAELRGRVRWRRVNLIDVPADIGVFDVILCRYTLDLLVPWAREQALTNLVAALRPGGRLVLGANETAASASDLVAVPGLAGGFERSSHVRVAA